MARKPKIVSPGQLEFARITVPITPRHLRPEKMDELLRLMCRVRRPGQTFTQEEIARFMGTWQTTIAGIERSALAKLKEECARQGILEEMKLFLIQK